MKIQYRTLLPIVILAISCYSSTEQLDAQVVVRTPLNLRRVYWGSYDPFYSATARIYAQADLIRAQSDAVIDYADARNLHAQAYSKELDNWQKQVRVYWDRKIIKEQKQLELSHVKQIKRMKYINDRKWQNSRDWDRLKNLPELNGTRIQSGSALNFLMSRLAASSLPYSFDADSSQFASEALDDVRLDEKWFSHIKIKQGAFTFYADQPVQKEINFWPYLLRWEEFEGSRRMFEQARVAAVQQSEKEGQVSVENIKEMQDHLMTLTNKLHGSKTVDQWVRKNHRFLTFGNSDRFLRELDRELKRVEKTGNILPFRGQNSFDPNKDGNHVVSLLCYMNRNGIEFAPAEPGSEFAYHNLFVLMRSIYLTVAESDESIQPANLGEIAK